MITVQQLIDSCKSEASYAKEASTVGSPLWQDGMKTIGKKFDAAAAVMQEQQGVIAIGDRLAHELMHKDHPQLLDSCKARGGHDACTVCNPTVKPATQPLSCTPECFYHGTSHAICMAF